MDENKLSKAELAELINEVIDITAEELALEKANGQPDHNNPGLSDDFAESDAVMARDGVAVKAEEDEEEDEKEEEEGKKSNTATADLLKSQMKGMVDLNKAVMALNAKLDRLAKSPARPAKSVTSACEVEAVNKANVGGMEDQVDPTLIKSNRNRIAKALADLHAENKIPGSMVTAFELYGESKIPDTIKKSVYEKANLLK